MSWKLAASFVFFPCDVSDQEEVRSEGGHEGQGLPCGVRVGWVPPQCCPAYVQLTELWECPGHPLPHAVVPGEAARGHLVTCLKPVLPFCCPYLEQPPSTDSSRLAKPLREAIRQINERKAPIKTYQTPSPPGEGPGAIHLCSLQSGDNNTGLSQHCQLQPRLIAHLTPLRGQLEPTRAT